MSSLSGILSLQDAFNTETITFPSLNPQHLTLGNIKERDSKTYFPSYIQPILYDGIKLVLQTPAVLMPGLTYHHYSAGDAVLMTVSSWLRQQFNIIDQFVRDAVTIPQGLLFKWPYRGYSYKPICQDVNLYLIMNSSCSITQETEEGVVELSPTSRPSLSEGFFSLKLEFEHVYIGWHNYGCLYSVNFRVAHIHFKPKTLNNE